MLLSGSEATSLQDDLFETYGGSSEILGVDDVNDLISDIFGTQQQDQQVITARKCESTAKTCDIILVNR